MASAGLAVEFIPTLRSLDNRLPVVRERLSSGGGGFGAITSRTARAAAAVYRKNAPRSRVTAVPAAFGGSGKRRSSKPGTFRPPFRDTILPIRANLVLGSSGQLTGGVMTPQGDLRWWLKYGTRPHTIRPRRAKVLAFWDHGSETGVFARSVNHPGVWGTTPNPHWEDRSLAEVEPLLIAWGDAVADGIMTAYAMGR